MFSRNSRYANASTYTVLGPNGTMVTVVRIPVREIPGLRGTHPRSDGQRLDTIAHHYLADATASWQLCDAANAVVPDALAVRDRIPVPKKET